MPDEDQLSVRQADQIRGDLYGLQDDLDFIKVQLARLEGNLARGFAWNDWWSLRRADAVAHLSLAHSYRENT